MKNKRTVTLVEAANLFTDDDKWNFSCYLDGYFIFETVKNGKVYHYSFYLKNEGEGLFNQIEFSALEMFTDERFIFELIEFERSHEI